MDLKKIGLEDYFTAQLNLESLEPDRNLGRVANIQKNTYLILHEGGEIRASLSGGFTHKSRKAADLPVVGDWVIFSWQVGDRVALIRKCLKRKNCISRTAAGSDRERGRTAVDQQMIAANIDYAFLVSGLDRDFNLRRIERYLAITYDSGAIPVVILNKSDLCQDPEEKINAVEEIAIGVPVHAISAETQSDLAFFHSYLSAGKTGVLLGSSGVGKSTIINRLLGEKRQAVRSVSSVIGKGVHTTTSRELLVLPNNGVIIDNPGMRELQIFSDESGLETTFSDIETLARSCRFSDCRHISEPGCAVKQAVEDSDLDRDRYNSYLKLHKELNFIEERDIKGYKVVEREQHRKIRLYQKQLKKQKRY